MKLAVVDLGTNTCRLLLAEVEDGVVVRVAARETAVVRLGKGVDSRGRLDAGAVARTRGCLGAYVARIAAHAPARRLLVATSVLRDAADGPAFLAAVERDYSLPCRLVAGEEEARLTFRGATSWLDTAPSGRGVVVDRSAAVALRAVPADAADVAVVDIGGGSTEFAVGPAGRTPHFACSIDAGAVRLTERFFADDPPTAAQWRAAVEHVDGLLHAHLPAKVRAAAGDLVGVAGTFTTLVAHEQGLRVYTPSLVHGRTLSLAQIDAAIGLFRAMTSAERARLAGIQKGREDVILAGALIARAACCAFGVAAVTVSEADILEGAALWLAEGLPALP